VLVAGAAEAEVTPEAVVITTVAGVVAVRLLTLTIYLLLPVAATPLWLVRVVAATVLLPGLLLLTLLLAGRAAVLAVLLALAAELAALCSMVRVVPEAPVTTTVPAVVVVGVPEDMLVTAETAAATRLQVLLVLAARAVAVPVVPQPWVAEAAALVC